MILCCGIYGEEKKGELIVYLYCFNFKNNRLICGMLCALALLRNLADIIPSSEIIPSDFRLDALFRQDELTKDFHGTYFMGIGDTGVNNVGTGD